MSTRRRARVAAIADPVVNPSAPRPAWGRLAAVAVAVYAAACTFSIGGLLDDRPWGDPAVYEGYASRMLAGELPYDDFYVEYPPGALPVFLVPEALERAGGPHYLLGFKLQMALLGLASLLLAAALLRRLAAPAREAVPALLAIAAAPAALGHVFLNRYDLWPALLSLVALSALVGRRAGVAGAGLAGSFSAKVYAGALLPVAAGRLLRTGGRLALARAVGAFAAVGLLVFGLFAALGPGGLAFSFESQARRGLHTESLGGSILLALDRLGLHDAPIVAGMAVDVGGGPASAIGTATSVLQVLAVIGVALLYLRGPEGVPRLLAAAAAATVAFVAFGKALSPQFLVWLVPLVPLVAGRRLVATGLLLAALVATQLEVQGFSGLSLDDWAVWVLLARNGILLALLAVLVAELRAPAPRLGSP